MSTDQPECPGCQEYEMLSRRGFLSGARLAAAAVLSAPAWLPRVVLARDSGVRDTLVVVFLRGGADGLSLVVPHGDPNLYNPGLRPDLAVAPPGQPGGAVDLDGFFGFSPAMAPLLPAYQSGQLAIVHATGSPDPTRSHFEAFNYMEYGLPLQPLTLFSGWLGRHLQVVPPLGGGPLRAVAIGHSLPKTLQGGPSSLPMNNPASFTFPGRPESAEARREALEAAYAQAHVLLASSAANTIDTIALLDTIDFESYVPAGGAAYPQGELGQGLKSIAALIKADIGLEAATIDRGGWDTHNQAGVLNGVLAANMDDLSRGLAAFHLDIQDRIGEVTVVVMSEFGRRADQNSSLGTDHGHGNCMFVMGGHIDGGQVFSEWTEGALLHPDLLYDGDSLQVTIDYRDIVAEIVQNRLGNSDLATVFPNYKPQFRGITL